MATYVDDSSGCNLASDTAFYAPYGKDMPHGQTVLLSLWDALGIPHKEKKQVSGAPLTVIGISVDPNAMTLTLPLEARKRLLEEMTAWSVDPPKAASPREGNIAAPSKISRKSVQFRLKRWQQMSGWTNYAFNVYPLLKPCLNNFYNKLEGKSRPEQWVYTNTAILGPYVRISTGPNIILSFLMAYMS